jgi:hypothetical protein
MLTCIKCHEGGEKEGFVLTLNCIRVSIHWRCHPKTARCGSCGTAYNYFGQNRLCDECRKKESAHPCLSCANVVYGCTKHCDVCYKKMTTCPSCGETKDSKSKMCRACHLAKLTSASSRRRT